jgi:hypothetical protein
MSRADQPKTGDCRKKVMGQSGRYVGNPGKIRKDNKKRRTTPAFTDYIVFVLLCTLSQVVFVKFPIEYRTMQS